jgi:hypothetical protein
MTSAAPTIDQGAESSTTDLSSTPPEQAVLTDVVSGPHTIVALGEDCLVCEEGLEPGQVYVFCCDATGSGVAHESCADVAGTKPAGLVHTDRALLR